MWLSTSTSTLLDLADEADLVGVARCGCDLEQRPVLAAESPTAGWPWRLSRLTMSALTLPSRTIFATSTVSASETRSPSTNLTSIPSRSM